MAFLVKQQHRPTGSSIQEAVLEQWIKVTQPAIILPASTTGQLFRVFGGKVLVMALIGTVTTVLDSTDPVLKVSSKQLSNAAVAVGTAVDIASTVSIASLEVGGTVFVEGDGTAIVKANAGCMLMGTNTGRWVAPQGEIYLTTGGTNLTGIMRWDLWYQPLDAGAFVAPAALTSSLLTAAI